MEAKEPRQVADAGGLEKLLNAFHRVEVRRLDVLELAAPPDETSKEMTWSKVTAIVGSS